MKNLKKIGLFCFAIMALWACSDDPDNNEDDNNTLAETKVSFNNGNPLAVIINDESPTHTSITGTFTNDDGLASYSVYYTNNSGTRSTILENENLGADTKYEFSINVPIPTDVEPGHTGSILIKVLPVKGSKVENATLEINYVEYSDPNNDYFTYSKIPEGLSFVETKAFPTADGHGKLTTGGRGGRVYVVTNLADSGDGSLRYAIERSGARIVVFAVSGTITLTRNLTIKNGDLTIAGQTAPGDGICITGKSIVVDASNVIIRYIRSRPAAYNSTTGDVEADGIDAMWGRNRSNVILDHCSFTWSTDEAASFYGMKNFTMQYCIVGESLYASSHSKGTHGYGGIWGGTDASFHHNLIISNDSRNPRFDGNRKGTEYTGKDQMDFINNVIFNWGKNSIYGGEGSDYNIVNNYFKPGPATKSNVSSRIMEIYDPNRATQDGAPNAEVGKYYFAGNYMEGNADVTANNALGVIDNRSYGVEKLIANAPIANYSIEPETAEKAFETVLAHVGVSTSYDAVDSRLIEFAKTGSATWGDSYGANSGIIDDANSVQGLPELKSGTVTDSDGDGMPDTWETLNGLNPNDKNDGNQYTLNQFYTNIEMYINSITDF